MPPEIEARLVAEARGKGIPVADVVKAHLLRSHAPDAAPVEMTPEERERALDELFDRVVVPTGIQEGAFHRENWYR